MDGTEFQLSLERLRECIHSRDNDEIENVLADLDSFTIEVERWPDGFYDGLVGLMRDPNFLGLANSWKLFYFITSNREQISEQEKERFREVLGEGFDDCGDWMGAFVIGEILSDHYADEVTLAILARLAKTASLLTRQLLRTLLSASRKRPTAKSIGALPFSSFKNWGIVTPRKSEKRRLCPLPSLALRPNEL